jgi:hypothetical protein
MAIINTELNELHGKLALHFRSLAENETLYGGRFEWVGTGQTIPCVVTKQYEGKEPVEGGYKIVRRCKFRYLTVNLQGDGNDRPKTNDVVIVKPRESSQGTRYRITFTEPYLDLWVDVTCEDSNT